MAGTGDKIPSGVEQSFDAVSHIQSSLRQPRSLRVLASLMFAAVRLSRKAAPRLAALNLVLQLVAVVMLGAQVLLAKVAIATILEEAGGGGSMSAVAPALIGLVLATGLAGLATSVQAQLQRLLNEAVQKAVRSSILGVTTTVSLETFENPGFNDDLQRVLSNAVMQPINLSRALVSLFGGGLGILVLGVLLASIEPLLLPILALAGIPQVFLSRRQGGMDYDFVVHQTSGLRLRDYLLEVLTGRDEAKEIRAFDLGPTLERRWDHSYRDYLTAMRGHVEQRVRLAAASSLVTFVATAAALGLLVWFAVDGRIELASAGAALIAIRLLATRIELTFSGVSSLFESSLFLQDYERFLSRRPGREGAPAEPAAPVTPFRELAVEHLTFRYPGSQADVLRDVSMRIGAGEVVALVGENGSGKTTLAKVLCHVFSPTDGRVTWDGVDTSELPAEEVRRHIGIIFQDFVRYQLSAHENIAFGRTDAVEDRAGVEAAARRGGAHDYLSALPDGYDTILGKTFWGGYDLSLGQWQRVAIARAFFREAQFLVLDEPTASLDARSEQRLFEQLSELAKGRSLLLISHRFSTVRSADRILVLHEGELIEEGSHDELMALDGHYAELFTMQASSYR